MKKIISIIAFSLCLCVSSFAQDKPAAQTEQPKAEIKTIYEYKAELGLTDKQEDDLRKILGDFQDYFTTKKKALTALQEGVGELIKNKEPIAKIRKQLQEMANLQVDASCFDIETSRKLEDILTPKQMAAWKAIQADFQKKNKGLIS